jgi:regulator of protease activity HflC (stomatin/prohibitin superfamily)
MSKIDDLKQEAKELGINIAPNAKEASIQKKIDEYYESLETSEKEIEEAVAAKEAEETVEEKSEEKSAVKRKKSMAELAKEAEAEARKTRVITIIDNDQRVNNQTTSCTVNCGNEYFDLGTMVLPLNMPVEVSKGHIDVLKNVKIPQHVKDPKTGLSSVVLRPRYTISYEDVRMD